MSADRYKNTSDDATLSENVCTHNTSDFFNHHDGDCRLMLFWLVAVWIIVYADKLPSNLYYNQKGKYNQGAMVICITLVSYLFNRKRGNIFSMMLFHP